MATRRQILHAGGAFLAGLALPWLVRSSSAADAVEVIMHGKPDGSHVWFDPIGILIEPGQVVRWVNRDPGNSHTATAYHPANDAHAQRIPKAAKPWDSDYLLPDESFELRFTVEGTYDYYCIPHEHAGMVGRIIVGRPGPAPAQSPSSPVPDIALKMFPSVDSIVRQKRVHPS
jgi:plastocyanin